MSPAGVVALRDFALAFAVALTWQLRQLRRRQAVVPFVPGTPRPSVVYLDDLPAEREPVVVELRRTLCLCSSCQATRL